MSDLRVLRSLLSQLPAGPSYMFAGPAILPFLVDEGEALPAQPRRLHVVAARVTDEAEYERLCAQLRNCGFAQSSTTPTVWSGDTVRFELFVTPYVRVGNSNRWHAPAFAARTSVEHCLSVISVPYFLACELLGDASIGVVLQLLACQAQVADLVRRSPEPVRAFVSAQFQTRVFHKEALTAQVRAAVRGFDDATMKEQQTLVRIDKLIEIAEDCDPALLLSALLEDEEPLPAPTPVPPGAVTFAESASVRFADYDATRSVLTIGFAEDRVYRYFAVPRRVFEGLCEAQSPGRFINQTIRDHFPYEEVV